MWITSEIMWWISLVFWRIYLGIITVSILFYQFLPTDSIETILFKSDVQRQEHCFVVVNYVMASVLNVKVTNDNQSTLICPLPITFPNLVTWSIFVAIFYLKNAKNEIFKAAFGLTIPFYSTSQGKIPPLFNFKCSKVLFPINRQQCLLYNFSYSGFT